MNANKTLFVLILISALLAPAAAEMKVVATTTVMSYALYTIAPETVAKFGSRNLIFTFPFVLYAIYRYLYLVYRKDLGGAPEKVFVTDVPMFAPSTSGTAALRPKMIAVAAQ